MSSATRSSSRSDAAAGGGPEGPHGGDPGRSFVDLHCHTAWSPDSLSPPAAVARVAAERGLTHLAVTDHDRIEGALEARAAARPSLTVIVGQEVRTREGDLIGLFIERAVPSGLSAAEAAAAIREQGGLVGLAHPFDRFRGSLLAGRGDDGGTSALAPLVDYVETFNARVPFGGANDRAAEWAIEHGLPGVAVSDAHTLMEVGVAYTILDAPVGDAEALHESLAGGTLVAGRGALAARLVTPFAKVMQRLRHRERFARGTTP